MTKKQAIFELLGTNPALTPAQLAEQAGCTVRTAEAYKSDWHRRGVEVKRCVTCGLAFELTNPEMVGGECLMCNLQQLRIQPRDFYEAGGTTHLVMRERPTVVASARRFRLKLEIELLQREMGLRR